MIILVHIKYIYYAFSLFLLQFCVEHCKAAHTVYKLYLWFKRLRPSCRFESLLVLPLCVEHCKAAHTGYPTMINFISDWNVCDLFVALTFIPRKMCIINKINKKVKRGPRVNLFYWHKFLWNNIPLLRFWNRWRIMFFDQLGMYTLSRKLLRQMSHWNNVKSSRFCLLLKIIFPDVCVVKNQVTLSVLMIPLSFGETLEMTETFHKVYLSMCLPTQKRLR